MTQSCQDCKKAAKEFSGSTALLPLVALRPLFVTFIKTL